MTHWRTENFTWPGIALLISTTAYTVATNVLAYLSKASHPARTSFWPWHVCGELVGIGTMLLAVVIVTSTEMKFNEWRRLAYACARMPTNAEVEFCTQKFDLHAHHMRIWMIVSTLLIFPLAFLHVGVEMLTEGYQALGLTSMMLTANVMYGVSVWLACRTLLLNAKKLMMNLERCLAGKSYSSDGVWETEVRQP